MNRLQTCPQFFSPACSPSCDYQRRFPHNSPDVNDVSCSAIQAEVGPLLSVECSPLKKFHACGDSAGYGGEALRETVNKNRRPRRPAFLTLHRCSLSCIHKIHLKIRQPSRTQHTFTNVGVSDPRQTDIISTNETSEEVVGTELQCLLVFSLCGISGELSRETPPHSSHGTVCPKREW